jgi:hypothetical protein
MEYANDEVNINVVAKNVETAELDENITGWAAVQIKVSGGSMLRLEFDASPPFT